MKSDNGWLKRDTLTVRAAATYIGVKTAVIQYHITNKKIECIDGRIRKSDCDKIVEQRTKYIGLKEYIYMHDGCRFEAKYANNRDKYIDFLENNDYFGIPLYEKEEMLFTLPDADEIYLSKEDVKYLDFKSKDFFENFGLSEEEKAVKLLKSAKDCPLILKYIKNFTDTLNNNANIYTSSYTAFIKTILRANDIKNLTDEDLITIVDNAETVRTKKLLIGFYKYVSQYEHVKYHNINFKKKETKSIPAYSYEEILGLAEILFSQDYDENYNLTSRAFENHTYAEMWLFLSLHFVCGWRATDICRNWVYPNLDDSENAFNINTETLKEDILNGNISDEEYEKIALYAIERIEMSNNMPHKTATISKGKLRSMMTSDLRSFFGKLILIGEYHHYTTGDGYIKEGRIGIYCSWVRCQEFFGNPIYKITGRRNISSRRLNKSYLQGIEKAARENGHTAIGAHMVASYARNHKDVNTTITYLRDHGLTEENADLVLYMMMQRGILSIYLYSMLITAFPEQFERMTMKDQTKLMDFIPISAYEMEVEGQALISSRQIAVKFIEGKTEEPMEILKAMYEIGNGRGRAKDHGVYCKKKALGECCENPHFESCIANVCPYHVFTSDGIPALIKVIKEYQSKALNAESESEKYIAVLRRKIIPAFQEIINAVTKEMSEKDKKGMKKLIMETLNE